MKKIFSFLAILMLCLSQIKDHYSKIQHNTDPEAKCTDGSSPILYLHEGGDTKKLLFFFMGGEYYAGNNQEQVISNSYKGSFTLLGSSLGWNNTINSTNRGILDHRPEYNRFATWTKMYLIYCDGSFHQGNRKEPIIYNNKSLYFRGAVNTRSHFKWADSKYNLKEAEQIIIAGQSAGGIAAYLWIDYIKNLVYNPKIVNGIIDAGLFFNPFLNDQIISVNGSLKYVKSNGQVQPQSQILKHLHKISNRDQKLPNQICISLLPKEDEWKCLSIQISFKTFKYPLLFIQSSYDRFIMSNFLNITCLNQLSYKGIHGLRQCGPIQKIYEQSYRNLLMNQFIPNLVSAGHAIWISSCSFHVITRNGQAYSGDFMRIPKFNGRTIKSAVEDFVFEARRIHSIDTVSWPGNGPCSN